MDLREAVNYCHKHNLVTQSLVEAERTFGIRVTLPAADTLRNILGENWEQVHWYAGEAKRDLAFGKMAEHHGYYRDTDAPTQVLEKISR